MNPWIPIVLQMCCTWNTQVYTDAWSSVKPSNQEKMVIEYHPIGEFHTDLTPQTGAPRQGILQPEINGVIEIYEEFHEALEDLDQCEYIIVLYHLHLSKPWHPKVRPPHSTRVLGLFATRSPNRPNPIGMSVIRIHRIENGRIHVRGIDAFDGTPVLDIKPWLPSIDCPDHAEFSRIEKEVGLRE
jgi:tRNA-Thr(GGU) m(6)t(6)A37 methyltransferase TsaA